MKLPTTYKGYLAMMRQIEKIIISDLKGLDKIDENIIQDIKTLQAEISNIINEIE